MFLYAIAIHMQDRYTNRDMQQFFRSRYAQIVGLTLGLALTFYLVIWLVMSLVGLADFPQAIQVILALLGAGLVVYKFFAGRIG